MNLADLARTILLVNRRPISKVRFARVIYFVHKDLIRKKLLPVDAIAYIRSPLGPIPVGFHDLARQQPHVSGIVIQHNESSRLSYTNDEFALTEAAIESESALLEQYRDLLAAIEQTLQDLRPYPTPRLVELSHREPSWLMHSNGEIYYITPADLKVALPGKAFLPIKIKIHFTITPKAPTTPENNASALQANLLRGMIEDIVKESTDIEYPDQQPPSPEEPASSPEREARDTENRADARKDQKRPKETMPRAPHAPEEPAQ